MQNDSGRGQDANARQQSVSARSLSIVIAATTVIIAASCSREPLAPRILTNVGPQDTVIVLGDSYLVDGEAIYEDGSRGRVTLQSLTPGVVSTQGVAVTAEGYGRARILVSGGLDTLWVTVVPDATLAAFKYAEGLLMLRTDMTGTQELFGEGDPGYTVGGAAIADWDPAGDRVLYSVNGALFFVTIGGQPVRVDPPVDDTIRGAASYPQMTADSTWIYFSAYSGYWNRSDIWRIRPNGSSATRVGRITPTGYDDGLPSPSPTGDRVAILTDPGAGNFSLLDILDPATGDIDPTGILVRFARWSPVDDRIAYADQNEELRVLDLATSQTRPIVIDATISHDRLYFDWSPDGEFLITTVARPSFNVAEGNGGLEIIQVESGIRMPIPNSQGLDHPAWGPPP